MMKVMKQVFYILIVFLLTACYDDKGNYDYEEINTITVHLDDVYSYRLDGDTTVCIIPELSQSLQKNKDNLEFMWLHSVINEFIEGHGNCDTISRIDTLRFHIVPDDPDLEYEHYFRLNVYDKLTEINYPFNVRIKLVKPYDGAWMILHNENGHAALGAVEYMGNSILKTQDAYYKETGKHLEGMAQCLGNYITYYYPYGRGEMFNLFSVITDKPEESGVMCQWKKFELMSSLTKMVYSSDQSRFNYSNVKLIDGEASWGAVCLSDGVLFQSPAAMKLYKANIATDLGDNIRIKYASKAGFGTMLYDEVGHRFCFYQNQSRSTTGDPNRFNPTDENPSNYRINPVPKRENNMTDVDVNNLPVDQKVLWVGAGYEFDPNNSRGFYANSVSIKGQDSCFVYEFNMDGMVSTVDGHPAFAGYYKLKLPEGMDENSRFASTMSYSGILFYTVGNVVYRLDFKQSGGKATPVYTHAGGKATMMKFAKKAKINTSYLDFTNYEFDPNRSLGIVFDMGNGKCDFVVLNLSVTGGIGTDSENYPATQVYTDFGDVKDILFL